MWASAFHQNILILVLSITIVSIEFHKHDVYFGKGISRAPILGIMGFCAIVLAVLSGIHFAKGATFVANSGLTNDGAMVIYCVMFSVSSIYGIVQLYVANRQKKMMK